MKSPILTAVALAIAVSLANSAQANDTIRFTNWSQANAQFSSLEAELVSLRARLDEAEAAVGCGLVEDCGGCTSCGQRGGCNCYCDVCCGWYGGVELVIVKPYFEDGIDFEGNDPQEPAFGHNVTPRFFVGYQNCDGLGARFRGWWFDHTTDEVDDLVYSLDVMALDFEATQLVCWGPMQATFSGGLRYGEVGFAGNEFNGETVGRTLFHGTGPTVATEARIPIRCGRLALIGNLRGSLLFGETAFDNDEDVTLDDDTLNGVLESQIGLEYARTMSNGGTCALRALMEGQLWMGAGEDPSSALSTTSVDEDLGFYGATVSFIYTH